MKFFKETLGWVSCEYHNTVILMTQALWLLPHQKQEEKGSRKNENKRGQVPKAPGYLDKILHINEKIFEVDTCC